MNSKFQAAPDYIKDHFEPNDRLAIVLINREKGLVQQEFKSAREIVEDRYQAHLRGANRDNFDVYATVNTLRPGATGRTKEDIDQIRHIYLDVDGGGKEAVAKILNAPGVPKPHAVLETSPGKHQLLWQVDRFDKPQAEELTKGMVRAHNADIAVVDSARVLRVPGFRNCKYPEPHYVKNLSIDRADKIYTPDDFPKYQIERYQPPQEKENMRQWAEMERTAGKNREGGVDQSAKDYGFACRRLEAHVPPHEIVREMAEYRAIDGKHHNPYAYAQRTVDKVIHDKAQKPSPPTRSTREYYGPSR